MAMLTVSVLRERRSHLREPPVTHLRWRANGNIRTLAGMRMLTGLCTALLLLAPAARPAYADELVVDDSAPTVQVQGTWAVSSTSSGFSGTGYRYRVDGNIRPKVDVSYAAEIIGPVEDDVQCVRQIPAGRGDAGKRGRGIVDCKLQAAC